MNCDDIAMFGGGSDKDNGTRGLWIFRPRHWPRRPRQNSRLCSRTWCPEVTDPRVTNIPPRPHDPNLFWLAGFPLQAKAGMALASWRPPAGHLPQPPDVSRPCQKQLSPRSHLLQVVSEALDIPIHQQQQQQELLGGVPLQTPEVVIAEKSAAAKKFEFSRQSSPSPPTSSKTNVVTASDGQISNGFVLHGHNLPYVFEEATDPSGKKSIVFLLILL